MDPGQDDLRIALLHKFSGFAEDLFFLSASDPSPHVGDQAVAAELIAAILHFQKGTGMFGALRRHFFKAAIFPDIIQG